MGLGSKLLVPFAVVAVLAVVLPVFFPALTQRLLFRTSFEVLKLKHSLFPGDELKEYSPGARAFADLLRANPIKTETPEDLRKSVDAFGDIIPAPSDAVVTRANISQDLYGYWVYTSTYTGPKEGEVDKTPVILYFHGGGYCSGSITSYAGFAAELARRISGRVFLLEYRLAPEHVLPAQVDDAVQAFRWLRGNQKIDPKRIAFAGDSAGGGLTLLTLLALNEFEKPPILPAAAVTISAFTDMAGKPGEYRPSFKKNKAMDAMTSDGPFLISQWATGTGPTDFEKRKSPKFSPIFANLEGLKFPPLLMHVGGGEILEDDTVIFAGKARQARFDITAKVWPYMQHVFQLFFPYLDESVVALDEITEFILKNTTA